MHEKMRHLAAWRDASFHYPSDFICRKSAEWLDSMSRAIKNCTEIAI